MKHFMVCVILLSIFFVISCSKKDIEDGWIKFDFQGNKYTIDQHQFMIRANPMMGEGEKIKTIVKGQSATFEFNLGPTPYRLKQEIESTGKELKQLAVRIIPKGVEISQFTAVWFIDTISDPVDILKNKNRISYDTPGLNLDPFILHSIVPGYFIESPSKERHSCWIIMDEITDERIKGRFGGMFQIDKIDTLDINEIKMFLDKEFEISGTFDVPFKKLYKFR